MYRFAFLFLCMCVGIQVAGGQDLSFGSFAIHEEVSFSPITDVFQDRTGLLWVGTVGGLYRYDGYNFKPFKNVAGDPTSLADNYVHVNAIAEDSKGYLWIGTRNGVSRYDPYRDEFANFYTRSDSIDDLAESRVMGVVVDRSNQVWLATLGGLKMVNPATGDISHYYREVSGEESMGLNALLSIVAGEEPYLWVGGLDGLSRFSTETGRFERFGLNDEVWSLYRMSDGHIWAGSREGHLYDIDPRTLAVNRHELFAGRDVPEGPGYVIDMMPDNEENFWVATYGGGLFQLKDGVWHQYINSEAIASLQDNRVSALFEDLTGNQWIGTWRGLNVVNKTKAFNAVDLSGASKVRATFIDQKGALWVGTEEDGLIWHLDGKTEIYDTAHEKWPLPSNQVSAIMEDHAGNLWVGSPAWGIVIFSPETGNARRITGTSSSPDSMQTNMIYRIIEDQSQRVWVGTIQGGLSVYDIISNKFTTFLHDPDDPESIGANEVISLYEDNTGQLWAGTLGGGLNRIDIQTRPDGSLDVRFKRYQIDPERATSISSNNVISLYRDGDGILWVGTMGGGLNRFDPELETFTSWTTQDGLPHNNITCILPDNTGHLWLPATSGLARFNPQTERFNVYTIDDGLESPAFYFDGCSSDAAGNLYMPHTLGVTMFNPEEIEHNEIAPTVLISDVLLFNESHVMDSSALYKQVLDLNHDQNFLTFTFGSTDYTIPGKNRYRYQLEGIDPDWVYDRGIRLANYPALQPGSYTFNVEAANNDGVWSDTRSMKINISRPYWQRWWFRLVMFFGGVGLVAGFFKYRNLQQKRLYDIRQQIAYDLHDDISGDLGALTFFLGRIKETDILSDEDRVDASGYLGKVQRMMGDLRDVVWLVDPEFDTLGKLLDRIHTTGRMLAGNHIFELISVGVHDDKELPLNLRRHLFLMIKEALHNAVRHAEARTIKVAVKQDGLKLRVTIEDDGIGFDPKRNFSGKGIRSLYKRAGEGAISLHIDSFKERGTVVVLEADMT